MNNCPVVGVPGPNQPNQSACCDQFETFGRRDEALGWATQRLIVRVRGAGGGEILWGWRPLDQFGCTDLMDTALTTFDVDYLPWSYWSARDASVVGLDCDSALVPQRCSFGPMTLAGLAFDGSGTTHVTVTDPDGDGPALAVNSLVWAASFAEERLPLWSRIITYLVATNTGRTVTNNLVGGQPTASFNRTYREKFTVTHEYGHAQTIFHPILSMGEMFDGSEIDYTFMAATSQHTQTSVDWQSAAAAEGFGHYYNLLAWWDASAPASKILIPGLTPELIRSLADTDLVRIIDPLCLPFGLPACPPGVANETDWMAALWHTSLGGASPLDVLRMLGAAFPWPVSGESDAYWLNFTEMSSDVLPPDQFALFLQVANQAGIDR